MDQVKTSTESTSTQTQASEVTNPVRGSETGRRSFLRGSLAAGGAAAAVSSSSFLARSAHAAGSDIIKVGLVGCGGRGSGAAKDAMTADPGCRLTAIADVFYERMNDGKNNLSKTLGEQYEVTDDQSFSGWECLDQILATDIDVVLLATPPGFRPAQMEAAVKAGKHVFCEKPVAVDPVGVRRVMAASEMAKEKGLSVVSGLCWRYDLGVKATMEQIFSGAIGEIVSIQENYLTGTLWSRVPKPEWTPMHNQVLNWLYYRWLSGDHIVEQFIHSLDKAMWLHHDVPPVKCYGTGGRQVRTDPKFGTFMTTLLWSTNGRMERDASRKPGKCPSALARPRISFLEPKARPRFLQTQSKVRPIGATKVTNRACMSWSMWR